MSSKSLSSLSPSDTPAAHAAPFGIGIIGLGRVAQVHLSAYRALPNVQVVGGYDVDGERRGDVAKRYGIRIYSHIESLLEEPSIQALCVLTPPCARPEVVEACAQAGRHVLCEKPLALSPEDAQRMLDACAQHRVQLFYGASYRFLPAVRRARELIASNAIGRVLMVSEAVLGGHGASAWERLPASHYPDKGPGGSAMGLVDHGIHLVDAFSWLIDSPVVSVYGQGNVAGEAPRTEFALLRFANGSTGHLLYNDGTFGTHLPTEGAFSWGSSWDTTGYIPSGCWHESVGAMHVFGSSGALRIHHYANALYLRDHAGIRQVPLEGPPAPAHFAAQLSSFVDGIRRGAAPEVPGEAGLQALRVIHACYASAREAREVHVRTDDFVSTGDRP